MNFGAEIISSIVFSVCSRSLHCEEGESDAA